MKTIKNILILSFLLTSIVVKAQLEDVIVETYYISEAADSLDVLHGKLEENSVTYRIFIDLEEGYGLRSIFGDTIRPLKMESSELFFNHPTGASVSYNTISDFYPFGNMILDSYITLGFTDDTYFGIPKSEDPDSSVIGGDNHSIGMLSSENPDAGMPVKEKDGLVRIDSLLENYNFVAEFVDDSTFGSRTVNNSFTYLSDFKVIDAVTFEDNQIKGITDENIIMVAQVTTKGELSFSLNCQIVSLTEIEGVKPSFFYYHSDTLLPPDVINRESHRFSNLMNYPLLRGCTDPYFVQYDPEAGIDDGSCRDSIVLGCMDLMACNFDPLANFHVSGICCYGSDSCDDRNLEVVCPDYQDNGISLEVFPNIVSYELQYEVTVPNISTNNNLSIYSIFGNKVRDIKLPDFNGTISDIIEVKDLEKGMYILKIRSENGKTSHKYFIKE